MNVVLSVYTAHIFKEFPLPSINNADYEIVLEKGYFRTEGDIRLRLEILDGRWRFRTGEKYLLMKDGRPYMGEFLENQDAIYLIRGDGEQVSLIVKEVEAVFHPYEKLDLRHVEQITVGKDMDNDISYDYRRMVSRSHALLERRDGVWTIINRGQNGTYVNAVRVDTARRLHFGDYINIMGLHMVFLNHMLAVDTQAPDLFINREKLCPCEEPEEGAVSAPERGESAGKKIFHRAPRNYQALETGTVEIEEPPEPARNRRPPLYLTIGPALTMALPMLLGCMMMIYASQLEGGASTLYMYSGLVMAVSSALISVIWALLNVRREEQVEREEEAQRFSAYSEYLVRKTEEIKEKYNDTRQKLAFRYPAAADCLAYRPDAGILWNRNPSHEDFLTHRLGLGDIPFQVEIDVPRERFHLYPDELAQNPAFIRDSYEKLYGVPVTLDFLAHPLIGIVGGRERVGALEVAQAISAQIAANNCYTDVKMGFLCQAGSSRQREAFAFAKWLPHVWSEDRRTRFLAEGREEAGDVFYELANVFRTRMERLAEQPEAEIPRPCYVIFVADPSLLEGELFARYAFAREEGLGLTTILLAERAEELPNRCDFIIQNDRDFQGLVEAGGRAEDRTAVQFDTVSGAALSRFSRRLSGLQVRELEEGGEIPSRLTFFEMLGVQRPEEIPVRDLWLKNRVYENIRGMIGWKAGSQPCYLDVHEKYHGPHGLVAGTTGSGKSETLQTYILSLAVNYSPDDVSFFLIDYKGGGMAHLFDGLPHLAGQISNLSGNQVKRAMISIKSENRRRQRLFNENGVNNINAYAKLYKNGEALQPVPHLFIVIDEFAELKREEPDFMKEIISVAQVGRSLGVHLILATQKPSGTVDDNIWSNSRFRLCLRVQDRQDSMDMLHKPDAASITQAGRCYLQVGNDEVYELFQSGYSGALYDPQAGEARTDTARLLTRTGKTEMTGSMAKASRKKKAQVLWLETLCDILENGNADAGEEAQIQRLYRGLTEAGRDYSESAYNTDRLRDFLALYREAQDGEEDVSAERILTLAGERQVRLPEEKEKTQLDAVLAYLGRMAAEGGYRPQTRLWMPVLPELLCLEDFEAYRRTAFDGTGWKPVSGSWSLEIVLGRFDDPENQTQPPFLVDFARTGHLAVCGNIVSGKSTLLQTMAWALAARYTPEQVNLYGLDFSGKMLTALEEAPQAGGIVCENEPERTAKLFHMLSCILEERRALFRGGNYSQYVQVHGTELPAIFLFIDNYAAFLEKTGEAYEDVMIRLAREGVSHGIFLVVSGQGFGLGDIPYRLGENINTVLCLAQNDRFAYADLLHTMQFDVLPESGVRGRGLAVYDGRILEYQAALALPAENDYQRMERIREACRCMSQAWKGRRARQIPEIPEKPMWPLFAANGEFTAAIRRTDGLPVGYNEANAEIYSLPLSEIYCYLVWGAARSGKTNLLRVAIQSALCRDSAVCIMDSPEGRLSWYRDDPRVRYAADAQGIFDFFSELLPVFRERNQRKHQWMQEGCEEEEIFRRMGAERPYFIFLSDLAWFIPCVYEAEQQMSGFLENILAKGSLHNIYFIGALAPERRDAVAGYGAYETFAAYRTGMHLGGRVEDNPVLSFDYISYTERSKKEKPGIGQIPDAEAGTDVRRVVIPLVRRSDCDSPAGD